MRLSRSRISFGADPKQLLAAQQQAQNPSFRHGPSENISDVPPVPAVPVGPSIDKPVTIPAADGHPSFKEPAAEPEEDLPARPSFKEPPPEEDLPPRPSFKEPPPEPEEDLPPRPSFKEPPLSPPLQPKFADPPVEEQPVQGSVAVIPPTPEKMPASSTSPTPPRSGSVSPTKRSSRTSQASEDSVVAVAKPSVSRSGSGQSPTTHVRGPRISRGPRAPSTGGNVSGIINTLNRASSPPTPGSPNIRRMSGSPGRLPLGSGDKGKQVQRASLSRRTVASDAEDEVVGK
jgi:hypothetical protein